MLAALWALGAIRPGDLPWDSNEFRVSGATILVYLVWSGLEMRRRGGGTAPALPFATFYTVLLVCVVDSFLLRLTTYGGPWLLRGVGVLVLAAGSVLRLRALVRSDVRLLRIGRLLQLAGLPVALGSLAGTAVALLVGVPGALREDPPSREAPGEEAPGT